MPETNKNLVTRLREARPKRSKFSSLVLEAGNIAREISNKTKRSITNYHGNPQTYNQNRNRAIIGLGTGFLSGFLIPAVGLLGLTYGGIKAYQAYKDKKSYRDFPFNRDERRSD